MKKKATIGAIGIPNDRIIIVGPTRIRVGDKVYEEVPQRRMNKTTTRLLMFSAMLGSSMPGLGGDPISSDELVEEFRLIQQKKSSLSRRHRDQVVRVFNRRFREVKNNDQ